ncbi:MAG: hypothetical protein SGJ10_14210 [Bacteroidota bacterium]|nr:hypothetical protein [Bacteroidota bacterium]
MQEIIEAAWQDLALLKDSTTLATINEVIEQLDKGKVCVAEPMDNCDWQVN